MYFSTVVFLVVCTASAAEDRRLVLHSDLDISTALGNLESRVAQVESENSRLVTENNQLTTRIAQVELENTRLGTENNQLKTQIAQLVNNSQNGGDVYVRWGRNTCPGNGTEFIYKGIIGGAIYTSPGGGSNELCLPDNPTWNTYVDGHGSAVGAIYGTEIEVDADFANAAFGYNYHNQDPPCAVCHTRRASVVMVPGRSNCYPGWSLEYTGYLVAGYPAHTANSDYICFDSKPEELPHGLDPNSDDQHDLYFVEAHCGSLPCPPYHEGREIACSVCSK